MKRSLLPLFVQVMDNPCFKKWGPLINSRKGTRWAPIRTLPHRLFRDSMDFPRIERLDGWYLLKCIKSLQLLEVSFSSFSLFFLFWNHFLHFLSCFFNKSWVIGSITLLLVFLLVNHYTLINYANWSLPCQLEAEESDRPRISTKTKMPEREDNYIYLWWKRGHNLRAVGNFWEICLHTKIGEIDKRIWDQNNANTKIYIKTLKEKTTERGRENFTIIQEKLQ